MKASLTLSRLVTLTPQVVLCVSTCWHRGVHSAGGSNSTSSGIQVFAVSPTWDTEGVYRGRCNKDSAPLDRQYMELGLKLHTQVFWLRCTFDTALWDGNEINRMQIKGCPSDCPANPGNPDRQRLGTLSYEDAGHDPAKLVLIDHASWGRSAQCDHLLPMHLPHHNHQAGLWLRNIAILGQPFNSH